VICIKIGDPGRWQKKEKEKKIWIKRVPVSGYVSSYKSLAFHV